MFDMWTTSILVRGFTDPNRFRPVGYRTGNGRCLGPLEKPIAERAVSLKRGLTSLDNGLVRGCEIASDQEGKPTQNIFLIVEAGNDFGRRCMIAGIDWGCARIKPGHNSSLSLTPSNALSWSGVLNGGSLAATPIPPLVSLRYPLHERQPQSVA